MKALAIAIVAESDLLQIWEYIAEDSPINADHFLKQIEAKFNLLLDHAGAGKMRDDLIAGLRSLPIGNYIIFYQSHENSVEIIRVLHSARDIQNLF